MAERNRIRLHLIEPGPIDELRVWAGSECFHRILQWLRSSERSSFRDECLNDELSSIPAGWFLNLQDARATIEAWRIDYNTCRPNSALSYATPEEFAHKGKITNSDSHAE